jgi:hypothetical protein
VEGIAVGIEARQLDSRLGAGAEVLIPGIVRGDDVINGGV